MPADPTPQTEGEQQPTSGTMLGPTDADGDGFDDGTGWDTNDDGWADEIDVNGDGTVDGEDNDGDGFITIFDELGTGEVAPSEAQQEGFIVDIDPDFDAELDPANPPPSAGFGGEVTTPAAVNLANRDILQADYQGQQGSCAAFANAGLATLVRHAREGGDATSLWASAAYLYAYQVPATPGAVCGTGTYIHAGLDELVRGGAATRNEVPFRSATMPMLCESNPSAAAPQQYRIGSYEAMLPFNTARIREALAAGSPVVFGTPLSDGFFRWGRANANDTFDFTTDACANPQHCGGHAMLIVGYDDDRQAFRVLNSWGSDWGDRGYIWIAYRYFDSGQAPTRLYGYSVTSYPTQPPPLGTPDPEYFSAEVVGGVVVREVLNARGEPVARMTFRASMTEPLRLQNVSVTTFDTETFSQNFDVWMGYGNITIDTPITPTPGDATVTLSGLLRDGSNASTTISISIPNPSTDPDGLD